MYCTKRIFLCLVAVGLLVGIVFISDKPAFAESASPGLCDVQPNGVISAEMATGFRNYWSLYAQIANAERVSPELIAPIHYREHFGRDNPSNGQGIFQLYSLVKAGEHRFPSTAGKPVSDEEFVHQGRLAVQMLKGKVKQALTESPDPTLVKRAYYGYNGRNSFYASQARSNEGPWDGSPYVMNIPGVRQLTMMTRDGGGGPRKLDPRPGAFPIYDELLRQCESHSATAQSLPEGSQSLSTEPTKPTISGFDLFGLLDNPISKGGNGMKEFRIDFVPMYFGGELSLLVFAFTVAIGVSYMIYFGGLKQRMTAIVIATASAASLASALLADRFGEDWEFAMFGQNISILVESILAWATYPDRVYTAEAIVAGMLISFVAWLGIKLHRNGPNAIGEIVASFRPLISGLVKLTRQVLHLRHVWIVLAAIVTLTVAATRLNTDIWTFGSAIVAWVGICSIMFLNKQLAMDADVMTS